jgi:hypothetical protein
MALYLTSDSFDFAHAKEILKATYKGDLPELENLFHNRALSINFAADGICSGMTPLHIAACKGYTHIVKWIIHGYKGGERHMDVRIKESGYTPLHSVIIGQPVDPPPNNPPVVGALSNEEEKKKRTDMVKELLSTGDTDANAMGNFKVTPLHLAAKTGEDEIVKQLLDWNPKDGIYMNQRINPTTVDDTTGNTALHLAAGGGHDGVVKELLKYYKRNPVLEIAPTNKKRAAPLHVAAVQGYSNVVESLLKCGAPVNKPAEGGYTPLHFAVFAVCGETVTVLLQKAEGLMVSEADWQGLTPIEWAKRLCQTVPNDFTEFTPNERKKQLLSDPKLAIVETRKIRKLLEGFDVHGLRNDQQGYVDSANAILVGAALIASITFSSWLQPPLGFQFAMVSTDAADPPSSNYVLMEKTAMQGFWVFNSFSFCFAIATVVAGANVAFQKRNLSLKDTVAEMRRNVRLASVCLFYAVVGVLGAFVCAGFVDLPSGRRYQWYMGAPLLIGGLTCLGFLGAFLKSILDSFLDDIPCLKGITYGVYAVYDLLRWIGMRLGCRSGTDATPSL